MWIKIGVYGRRFKDVKSSSKDLKCSSGEVFEENVKVAEVKIR